MDDLRVVTRFAAECAREVLALFEAVHPDDHRPSAVIQAAWSFVNGAPRRRLRRYPSAPSPAKDNRVSHLMSQLDADLRASDAILYR